MGQATYTEAVWMEYAKDGDFEPIHRRVEVVRCRDCDFFATDRLGERCALMEFRTVGMSNGFCAWGRRRATLADLYGVWKEDA